MKMTQFSSRPRVEWNGMRLCGEECKKTRKEKKKKHLQVNENRVRIDVAVNKFRIGVGKVQSLREDRESFLDLRCLGKRLGPEIQKTELNQDRACLQFVEFIILQLLRKMGHPGCVSQDVGQARNQGLSDKGCSKKANPLFLHRSQAAS